MTAQCPATRPAAGSGSTGVATVTVWLARGLCRLVQLFAVASWLWCSGVPLMPRQRRYARRVHAAWRSLAYVLALCALVFGVELVLSIAASAAAVTAGAAVVTRRRAASRARLAELDGLPRRAPIRVRVVTEFPPLTRTPAGPDPDTRARLFGDRPGRSTGTLPPVRVR